MPTTFRALAELGEELERTTKRLEMLGLVADFLARLEIREVGAAISLLLGRPFPEHSQRVLDVSWSTLGKIIVRIAEVDWKDLREAFAETGDVGSAAEFLLSKRKSEKQSTLLERKLTIMEVMRSLEAIADVAGVGSREKKERLAESLLNLASPLEVKYVVRIFVGEMRIGFSEGLMEQAISRTFSVPLKIVQRANMIVGDIEQVAKIAKNQGEEGLRGVSFQIFRPVRPMLAKSVDTVTGALQEHNGGVALEHKLDGARVQIHKKEDTVRIFSRGLKDVTKSLPEVTERILNQVREREVILEGEVIAVNSKGHPIPFQHLMRRFRRVHEIRDATRKIPVELFLFEVLYVDGENTASLPYSQRRRILAEKAGDIPLTGQLVTDDVKKAERFLEEAMDAGHEGLMAKKLDGQYTPGIRGKGWLKIKPVLEPLDLVIVAAAYGYGRRYKWLSDYELGARDLKSGEFLTVGKTFKGLTDAEIVKMTERLRELTLKEEGRRVIVRPRLVVEILYNEIQRSQKYKSGMALRFARISRVREDKSPEEADTIQRIQEIYEKQFSKKGRYRS